MQSSSAVEVCCSENEFVCNEKTCSAAAEEGSVCKQQTSEGVALRVSSTAPTYLLQKKHHPLLPGNSEVPFLDLLYDQLE